MINWLKRFGAWILAGLAIAVAFLAKANPRKWQEKAVDNEEDDIQNDLHQAEVANQQAAIHDARAHEIKKEAEKPKGKESTKTLVERWRK